MDDQRQLHVHAVRPATLCQAEVWPADCLPVGVGVPLQQNGPE